MIKSVYKDLYLNIDQGTVVANGFPAAWKVEEVEVGVVRSVSPLPTMIQTLSRIDS